MGRKNEFKATKSFTITMSELSWLAEYSERTKLPASLVVNKLIREAMLADKTAVSIEKGPEVYCKDCNDWHPHNVDTLVCSGCNKLNKQLETRLKKKNIR